MVKNEKKFSVSVRINNVNPVHTRFQIFCALVLVEYAHENVTRASTGPELTLRNEEFEPFVRDHLKPHLVSFIDDETQTKFNDQYGDFFK